GVYDGQMVLLKRLGPHEGSTVSVTVLAAPAKATKAYSKGELAIARKHWDEAVSAFRKAVDEYPKYAVAWSELGRALEAMGNMEAAEDAYRQAWAADAMYLKPYLQFAALAARQ